MLEINSEIQNMKKYLIKFLRRITQDEIQTIQFWNEKSYLSNL